MNRTAKRIRQRRPPSIVLSSDEENDGNNNSNDLISTQYATPMANIDENASADMKPTILHIETSQSIIKHEEIDLISPAKYSHSQTQRNYLPYTLSTWNRERLSILPTYPTMNNDNDSSILLLANLPVNQLSEQERRCRQLGVYPCAFIILDPNANATSFMAHLYNTYYGPIIERFNLDLSIVDYNYLRLKKFIHLCQLAYIRTLSSDQSSEMNFNINENEFPQLLEFFLQIDIDLFYMKTCSFRQATPRTKIEGIFCMASPECRYVMEPCGNCALCQPLYHTTNDELYSVAFNLYQKHRFINGYESILNCPASCRTNNIIYTLTCQCGNYDYIGETIGTLLQRLSSHQCFIHRLIIEKLIGEKNYIRFWGVKTPIMLKKDSTRVYQHPMHCSSVIQSFLNKNPDYWIFIPMLNEEANQENIHYQSSTTDHIRHDNSIQQYINVLPKPPNDYKFSKYQIKKQYEFFKMKQYEKKLNSNYIAYNATMIAVLPLNTSDLFRRLIHSLFVVHTEAKLNKLGHIFNYPLNTPINQTIWCANLRRPRH